MIIIGAGLAGLLCGALNPGSTIYEAKPKNEISHKALFRLRSNRISELTGISLRKVQVTKGIWFDGKSAQISPRLAHLYSKKVSSKITDRSITNLDTCTRYIPPEDFIQKLISKNTDIRYNYDYFNNEADFPVEVVSTIPMPILAYKLKFNEHHYFNDNCIGKKIFINQLRIKNCDSYSTIYYPNPKLNIYRASLNGDILIIESTENIFSNETKIVLESFGLVPSDIVAGIVTNHTQQLGKINEIDDKLRSDFITEMSISNKIYSLGRFATWRPKILLDDICEDIFIIRRLIEGGNYAVNLYKQNK